MVDADLLKARLQLLEQYMSDLDDVRNVSLQEFQENKVLRRFVERTLQLAMEACLDIGSHVISASGFREPRFGRDIFVILAENGWLDESLAERLVAMAGFHNILVHDHATLDDTIVYGVLQARLADLRAFAIAMLQRLDGQSPDVGSGLRTGR